MSLLWRLHEMIYKKLFNTVYTIYKVLGGFVNLEILLWYLKTSFLGGKKILLLVTIVHPYGMACPIVSLYFCLLAYLFSVNNYLLTTPMSQVLCEALRKRKRWWSYWFVSLREFSEVVLRFPENSSTIESCWYKTHKNHPKGLQKTHPITFWT